MQPATPTASPPTTAPVLPAPRFFDYFLVVCGFAISVFLAHMSGLRVEEESTTVTGVTRGFHAVLPQLLFLPMGVVLFWPIFFSVQRLFGRELGMTLGEWLWGVAWLGNLFFSIWYFWHGLGNMPEQLKSESIRQTILIGYLLFLLALGVIAVMLFLGGMMRRGPMPWTHRFCLALLSWPLLPLAALWFGKITFAS